MQSIPYIFVVGSLMYLQTCTRPDISFVVEMLGRYQSNHGINHWKVTKKVLWYFQGIKEYMLMYIISNHLEVIGYSNSNFVGCIDNRKSTFGYLFLLGERAISWKNVKEYVILSSTIKVEFVACF